MTSRDFLIFSKLNSFYPEKISFLPVKSPFIFLVTVMLSASSTDIRASAAADRLFFAFLDEKSLAGMAYINVAKRITGEDVPLLDIDEPDTLIDKIKKFFAKKAQG